MLYAKKPQHKHTLGMDYEGFFNQTRGVRMYPCLLGNRPYHVAHYGLCKNHISLLLNSYFLPYRPPLEVKESR